MNCDKSNCKQINDRWWLWLQTVWHISHIPYTLYHKTYRADDLAQTQCLAGSIALLIDLLKRGSEAGKL